MSDPSAPAAAGILYVVPTPSWGEAARGALDVARTAASAGYAVHVAAEDASLGPALSGHGIRYHKLPLGGTGLVARLAHAWRLGRLVRLHGIEIVHAFSAFSSGHAWSAMHAAERGGALLVTTVGISPAAGPFWRRPFNQAPLKSARVIAVFEHIAEELGRAGVEPGRVRLVRPGVDTSAFDAGRVRGLRVAALAERWHLGFERKIVMLPGPVREAGGHLLMLAAMRRMARTDFTLLIVGDTEGDGSFVRKIEAQARRLGLTERVHYAGGCDDWPAAYMLADLVAVPALEAYRYARGAIEAQAMGKLVIANHTGGLDEAVKPAATGWLVKAEDPAELAWALDLALNLSDDDRARHAEHARAFVEQVFDLERACQKTLGVYRELTRSPEAVPSLAQVP